MMLSKKGHEQRRVSAQTIQAEQQLGLHCTLLGKQGCNRQHSVAAMNNKVEFISQAMSCDSYDAAIKLQQNHIAVASQVL